MKSYLYYLKYNGKYLNWSDTSYASEESHNRPLIVNCASCVNTPEQHKNTNAEGRLDYMLIYVIEGTLKAKTPSGDAVIEGGDVAILPPKTPYEIDCAGETIYFLTVHFTGSEVISKLKEYGISVFPKINTLSQKTICKYALKSYLRDLQEMTASEIMIFPACLKEY